MKSGSSGKNRLREKISQAFNSERPFSIGFRMMPMIDMLFLLLIFFLLTLQFHPVESFLPFQLPGSAEGAQFGKAEPLNLILKVRSNGCAITIGSAKTVVVNAKTIDADLAAVAEKIASVMKHEKRTAGDPIEFICESGVEWQYIAKLYNVLFGIGIKDITFRMTE